MSQPLTASAAAFDYLAQGFSVIPIRHGDKRPLLAWKEFQARRPKEAEVVAWFRRWPDAGVAIVCGVVSGLAVVDFDPRNGDGPQALADRLPRTPTAETGGGGRHFYFIAPLGGQVAKVPALLPGVDLQAEASYVIAPPSAHPSGRRYCWLPGLALGEVPLAPLPTVVRQLIALQLNRQEEMPRRRRGVGTSGLTLDAILSALDGVRRCGPGWVARCPAHEDREPSLSIGEDNGRVLLHCFAGCSFTEIVAALREEAA